MTTAPIMTRGEVCQIIRDLAGGELAEELDYWINCVEREPEDWPEPYDEVDALADIDGSDLRNTPAVRRNIMQIERRLGMWRRVTEQDSIMVMSGGRSRMMRPGGWVFVRRIDAVFGADRRP